MTHIGKDKTYFLS